MSAPTATAAPRRAALAFIDVTALLDMLAASWWLRAPPLDFLCLSDSLRP